MQASKDDSFSGFGKFRATKRSIPGKSKRVAKVMGLSSQLNIVASGSAARIAIRAGHKILFIDPADITAVEADGHYVLLRHRSGAHTMRGSISTMAEKLSLFGFVRIHRSTLVNVAFVEEIQPLAEGEYLLRVRGGKKYTLTRTYKNNLPLFAESWIDTDGFVAE
jgi:DNA-binding LytR/AlgR family response regulator